MSSSSRNLAFLLIFLLFAGACTIQQDAGDLGALIYAVDYDDRIYRFINYTAVEDFDGFETAFATVTRSFDELTDPEILNVQPVRLEVIRVDQPGPFQNFLPDPLPMGIDAEEVAIINQLELDDIVIHII